MKNKLFIVLAIILLILPISGCSSKEKIYIQEYNWLTTKEIINIEIPENYEFKDFKKEYKDGELVITITYN